MYLRLRRLKFTLRLFNNCLSTIVAVLALYIILAPVLPEFTWWAQHDTPVKNIAPPVNLTPVAQGAQQPILSGEVLVIPSIDMQETINEGANMWMLHFGAWRLPFSSTPDKGGNTVIAGHRFTYANPKGVFYYLDKIQVGDPITVYWNGTRYAYRVVSTSIVPPTDVAVEGKTSDARLTLYTCTPLWTATNRLIIVAKPVQEAS